MDLIKKPGEDVEAVPAFLIALGWMVGWAFALWLSSNLQISYTSAFATVYGSLVILVVLAVCENRVYWGHILRINEHMHR